MEKKVKKLTKEQLKSLSGGKAKAGDTCSNTYSGSSSCCNTATSCSNYGTTGASARPAAGGKAKKK